MALTPAGLYVPGPFRPTAVPWWAVERGHVTRDLNGGAYVTVAVSERAAVASSIAGRIVRLVNRRFGGDLHFSAQLLTTKPEFLAYAIDTYRRDPGRRRIIGTVDELDRLYTEWIRDRHRPAS
ncbi:hypothetical protein [Rhizomonospora bruguierae]|uniref:hypothetical protein n=1 Tax=Rhizomonospora bruguierae TaxID=1581705 RepID=UPI001BCB5426|nr:hypothetical protein [Micromonospora sp. NBRC 107566]